MNILSLNTQSLSAYGGAQLKCSDGKICTIDTNAIMVGFGVVKSIDRLVESIAPPYSACLVLSDTIIANATARQVEKQLAACGYRVRTHTFEKCPRGSFDEIKKIVPAEDTKMIVGVGGSVMANLTKALAFKYSLPSAFIASTPSVELALSPHAVLYDGEVKRTIKTDGFKGVMCDSSFLSSDTGALTRAFGSLVANLISLFDYKISAILKRDEFNDDIYEYGMGIVEEAIMQLGSSCMTKGARAAYVAQMSLRYSAVGQMQCHSTMNFGSQTAVAHALELLFTNEEREILPHGEVEMIASRVIGRLYKTVLSNIPQFLTFPPDLHLRMDALKEYLGLSEAKSAALALKVNNDAKNHRLMSYRLKEYKTELILECIRINKLLDMAWKVFKRMHADDGYELLNYFTANEVGIALALASDLSENFTFLTYLKNAGLLEEYIV